jgi:TetR/AcrR family tetracycline transcriptional repressor
MALDRNQIITAAFVLLREGGLEALSMRRLAERLDVQGATLYHHFPNKRTLLDHVAEELLAPVWRRPMAGKDWRTWVLETSALTRDAMLSCKDGAILCAGGAPTGTERSKELIRALYQPLLDAGFSNEQARFLRMATYRFTLGWTIDEQASIAAKRGRLVSGADDAYRFGLSALIRGFPEPQPQPEVAPATV